MLSLQFVFGQAHKRRDVITQGLVLYGEALSELRNKLSYPKDGETETVLASMTALYIYEVGRSNIRPIIERELMIIDPVVQIITRMDVACERSRFTDGVEGAIASKAIYRHLHLSGASNHACKYSYLLE